MFFNLKKIPSCSNSAVDLFCFSQHLKKHTDPKSIDNYFLTITECLFCHCFLRSYFVFISIIDFCTVTLQEKLTSLEFTMSAVGFITVFACNLDFFFIYVSMGPFKYCTVVPRPTLCSQKTQLSSKQLRSGFVLCTLLVYRASKQGKKSYTYLTTFFMST